MRQQAVMCFFYFLSYYSNHAFYKPFTSSFFYKKNNYLLHLCTIKSPINGRFTSDKGNSYHALEMCEGVKSNNNDLNPNDLNPDDLNPDDLEIDNNTSKIFNKNFRLGRSKDQDGKSNIWSVEPKMEVVDEEITGFNKNILISGLIITGFLVSLPILYTLNQYVQNIDY
jgi:hypothetical protein